MQRIYVFVVTVLVVLGAGEASAQARRIQFQPCPPETMRADLLRSYPHWDPSGMGVAPVSRELAELLSKLSNDAERRELTSRFLQGRILRSDSPEMVQAIMRTKMRIDLYLVLRIYNRDAVNNDELYRDLPKVQGPAFQKIWNEYTQPGNLIDEVFPCGSTIPLTSEAPDGPGGRVQISIKGLHVSTGYEPGVIDPLTKRPGIQKIGMIKSMPLPDDSPYKEEKTFDFFILPHCGNPGDEPGSDVLNPSITVEEAPQPAITQQSGPLRTTGNVRLDKTCFESDGKTPMACPPLVFTLTPRNGGEVLSPRQTTAGSGVRTALWENIPTGQYTLAEQKTEEFIPEYIDGQTVSVDMNSEVNPRVRNIRVPKVDTSIQTQKPVEPPKPKGPSSWQGMIAPSVSYLFGNSYVDYTDATSQNPGNADRRFSFQALELGGRADFVHGSRIGGFLAGGATILDKRGEEELKDAFFDPLREEKSTLPMVRFRAGPRFGQTGYVGGFVGYHRITDDLEYDADGAHSVDTVVYTMNTWGAEVGYTNSVRDPRFAVRFPFWKAYKLSRTGTYQQTKPGFNFPSITRNPQDGDAWGVRAEAEVRIGPVNLIGAFDHTKIDTFRPQRFEDVEKPKFTSFSVGVSVPIGFGRR